MAMEAGAALANMTSFWGQPALVDPEVDFEGNVLYQMGTARSAKGVILVNRNGKRFVNEGVTYQDFPKALGAYDPVALEYPTENVWLVFDQNTKDSTVLLPSLLPGAEPPEWMTRASTIRELAGEIGVDPDALEATVARWNEHVAAGEDPDFHRGTVRFESHMSGSFPTPERVLGAVETGPFYAMPLYDGTLGTNGGPRIDADGRVLRHDGNPIPGPVRRGQRERERVRARVSRRRRHHRARAHIRLPRRPSRREQGGNAHVGDLRRGKVAIVTGAASGHRARVGTVVRGNAARASWSPTSTPPVARRPPRSSTTKAAGPCSRRPTWPSPTTSSAWCCARSASSVASTSRTTTPASPGPVLRFPTTRSTSGTAAST